MHWPSAPPRLTQLGSASGDARALEVFRAGEHFEYAWMLTKRKALRLKFWRCRPAFQTRGFPPPPVENQMACVLDSAHCCFNHCNLIAGLARWHVPARLVDMGTSERRGPLANALLGSPMLCSSKLDGLGRTMSRWQVIN